MSDAGTIRAIGLMSGTSMDGIDVALIETDGGSVVRSLGAGGYEYDAAFRRRLAAGLETAKAIRRREERPGELAELERDMTDRHVDAVRLFASQNRLNLESVRLIGFHGQTVLHRPADALTVQLGDGARMARRLGIATVYDMRAADMAEGGQGAPLIPAFHAALSRTLAEGFRVRPVVFVNIGGISNITYVDGDADPIAFDTGPGNALIDQWVSREAGIPFDQNGAVASEGGIIDTIAEHYLQAGFYARSAPKSLDRFDFAVPGSGTGSLEDVARTLCFVAAQSVLMASAHLPREPKLWIVGGGGRKHPAIMQDLRDGAARRGARVATAEEAGLDGDALEAEAWAYLAVRSLQGLPLSWPTTTGCRRPTSGGVLAEPISGASA